MQYKILKDRSPFYVTFTFPNIEYIVNFVRNIKIDYNNIKDYKGYMHYDYSIQDAENIINLLPMSSSFNFLTTRVSLFITPPGGMCPAHKDGKSCRMGLNLPIEVYDNECITTWYSDSEFQDCEIIGLPYSRRVDNYYQKPRTPLEKLIVENNQFVLFNTDIFHAWTNKNSKHVRKILTLRVENYNDLYFEQAKTLLFNN